MSSPEKSLKTNKENSSMEAFNEYQYRKTIVKLVAYIIHKYNERIHSTPANKDSLKIILKKSRHIELILYRNATSFAEYIDVSTLSRRITSAAYCLKGTEKLREHLMNIIVGDLSELHIQCPGSNKLNSQSEVL